MIEPSIVRGLLICERVEHNPRTRRLTLVNRTTAIAFRRFPTRPRRFSVFASLTNGLGRIPIRLEIVHLETDAVVSAYRGKMEFTDRLREEPFLLNIRDYSFSAPGTYQFTLYAADEPLASQILRLTLHSSSGGPP